MRKTGGRYQVGRRRYRGHAPGSVFEAALDPLAERRAIARGSIALLERIRPSIQPGSFALPEGWAPPNTGGNT